MHIYEGMLSGSPEGIAILGTGFALSAAGTALGLRKLDYEKMPQVAMLSSAFFVVSLIPIPLGVSIHLVLCGLIGLILGWAAFPAMLVALFLQAIFFSFGGPTTLGINTLLMALPAVACYYVFRAAIRSEREAAAFWAGFTAGVFAFVLAALLHASALFLAGEEFQAFAVAALGANLLVAVIEGLVTGSVVVFLRKVRPELLQAPLLAPRCREVADA